MLFSVKHEVERGKSEKVTEKKEREDVFLRKA